MSKRVSETSIPLLGCFILFIYLSALPANGHTCQTVVSVDQAIGEDCRGGMQDLAGLTCSELQDVLVNIGSNRTVPNEPLGCIEVTVLPGDYVIDDAVTLNSQSLVLRGVQSPSVRFDFDGRFDPTVTIDPFYVISIANAVYVEISGIEFHTSPGIIAIESTSSVVVKDCSFRGFYQGALDVYKSISVNVTNCTFEDNGPVSVIKQDQFRGHSGGLSIGYADREATGDHRVTIWVVKCTFRNNTSVPDDDIEQSTTQLFQGFIFTGRGGGCSILVNSTLPANTTVEDCFFEGNNALSFGGGLYFGFTGFTDHVIVVNRVRFVRNWSVSSGGLQFGFVKGLVDGVTISLLVYNSVFIGNQALYGGGIQIFAGSATTSIGQLSNSIRLENCTFLANTASEFGAAMLTSSLLYLTYTVNVVPLEIVDCQFIANNGRQGGVMSTAYLPLSFRGVILFQNNSGLSLANVGTTMEIHGEMLLIGNDGVDVGGTALFVTSFGQLVLFDGASLNFEDNHGGIGAALVVDNHDIIPEVFSRLANNPLCVFTSENRTQEPNEWNVAMSFTGNQAFYASAVFTNNINLCSWIQYKQPSFDSLGAFRWNFTSFFNNQNAAHASDVLNPDWYVQTPPVRLNITTDSILVFPGEKFQVGIEAFDELGRPSAAAIRLSDAEGDLIFSPAALIFSEIETRVFTTTLIAAAGGPRRHQITVETLLTELVQMDTFDVITTDCPPGWILSTTQVEGYTTCICNFDNSDIVDCNERNILLMDGLWGTSSSDEDSLATYPCPPQYCMCRRGSSSDYTDCNFVFDSQDPDSQCSCDREGVLCGDCTNAGVSALLNKCVSCHNASGILIAALIIADGLIFLGLLLIKLPLPEWFYPCLFYLQILPYLTSHFPETFEKVHPYVYYVGSGLSFYFIYDFCLYESLNPLASYFLRYLPLFVSVIIGVIVLIVRRHYNMIRTPWYGLWWVVLLQYTHVVHTSMSILNCPTLPNKEGMKPRWYISGSVTCFENWHTPLGILAILVLVFCISLIPIMVVYSYGWIQRPRWLQYSIEPILRGFKENCRWWPAFELARRFLLVLFIVVFPGNEYPAIFILALIFAIFGFLQPYEHLVYNILETALFIDVLTLLLLRNTEVILDDLQKFSEQNKTANTGDECSNNIEGVTNLTVLLSIPYYIPLAVFAVIIITAVSLAVRYYVKRKSYYVKRKSYYVKRKSYPDESESPDDLDYQIWRDSGVKPTTTTIELTPTPGIRSLTKSERARARLEIRLGASKRAVGNSVALTPTSVENRQASTPCTEPHDVTVQNAALLPESAPLVNAEATCL